MRLLQRNTTEFEYLAQDEDQMTDLNSDGEHTGQMRPVYATPVKMRGNISTPSGHVNQTFYGTDTPYTHTLVMDDPDAPISETGIIRWKGYEYDILAVRPSINSLSAALRRRTKYNGPVGVTGETGATGETGGE